MTLVPNWNDLGQPACEGEDPEWWFATQLIESKESNSKFNYDEVTPLALKICAGCDILEQCRDWGLRHELYGIWGGMTAQQRRNYRRDHKIPYEEIVNISQLLGLK